MPPPLILRNLGLDTREGNVIPNWQCDNLPPFHYDEAFSFFHQNHPSLQRRSATSAYNCFGLVFATRRAWINHAEELTGVIMMILQDDKYAKLAPHEAKPGDIAIYRRGDSIVHAGLVYNVRPLDPVEIWVMSQWGADGEYTHQAGDVPEVYGRVEFWTDRK
jgi:hypothetical protein